MYFFIVDDVAELHDQFPVVSQWYDSFAAQPAFIAAVRKVGISLLSADSCNTSTTQLSNTLTKTAVSFLTGKWKLQRNRLRPLLVIISVNFDSKFGQEECSCSAKVTNILELLLELVLATENILLYKNRV